MDFEELRLAVYRSFAAEGRPPDVGQRSIETGLDPDAVTQGLKQLAQARHLVLDDQDQILMAHPFAAIPLGFAVMGANTLWWGGCAWDSFAVPHLLPDEGAVLVSTRCPGCSRPLAWNVGHEEPPPGDEVAHFLVPAVRIWDDVVHSCRHQRIFCSTRCVDDWLSENGLSRGYVMDLPTLWRLAAHWYDGRLELGYVRREPAEAADYLASVGLSGPFWGL